MDTLTGLIWLAGIVTFGTCCQLAYNTWVIEASKKARNDFEEWNEKEKESYFETLRNIDGRELAVIYREERVSLRELACKNIEVKAETEGQLQVPHDPEKVTLDTSTGLPKPKRVRKPKTS